MNALEILVERPACYELVIATSRLPADSSVRARPPGRVRRYANGAATLHIGPGRWLLVGRAIERTAAAVAAGRVRGGSLVDVRAKWLRLSVMGPEAQNCLSRFLNVAGVLRDRDCAPVSILDCPTLLARCERGFELWTSRSWGTWLHDLLTRSR